MSALDITIVIVYLLALFGWAFYIGLRQTVDDFLVLSRKAPFILVLFSIVSTWVGIGTTVATASSGFEKGISLGLTAASGGILGIVIAAWFAPILKRFGDKYAAHSLGDFYGVRYSYIARMAAAAVIFFVYMQLTAAQFVGLASLLEVWSGLNFEIVVWFAAVSTVIYTAFAGIKSDFYTDVIHFFVMFIVLFMFLMPVTSEAIGGISELAIQLPSSFFDPFAYGGIPFFIAGLAFGGGSVFVTMEFWQRIYSSNSEKTAQQALLCSIFIIIAFYSVSVFFGLAARILFPELANPDHSIFMLMKSLLPTGILGFGLAGFFAVFISTVNSTIMVASATFAKDFYAATSKKLLPPDEMLKIARLGTLICGLFGVGFAFLLPDIVALSVNSLLMLLILLPSVVFGFFWKRSTAVAATASISIGFIFTMGFSLLINPETAFVPGFLISLIVFVVVSCLTKHAKSENAELMFLQR